MKPEPYKIKAVESISLIPKSERKKSIEKADYCVFRLKSKDVYIDLLTDSGTNAMSDKQWSEMMKGDEAYAGSKNFFDLEETVQEIFGFNYVIPTHQGRGAENVLFGNLVSEGDIIPNNTHFDTTEAHVEANKGDPVNCLVDVGYRTEEKHPFKGNMDCSKLEELLNENEWKIPLIMLTITNNTAAGQPVSMENIKEVSKIANKYDKPLFIDAARFADNAYFIKEREEGYQEKTIKEIIKEIFSYANGFTMSSKKDMRVNIGGLLAMDNEELYEKCRQRTIFYEGFPTYGGLAGRDLGAMAQGLREAVNVEEARNRVEQVRYLGEKLEDAGVPIVLPPGGHAIYLDALKWLPNMPRKRFPADAINTALYIESGIRGVGLGGLAFANKDNGEWDWPDLELTRLAIPRRVYTKSHLDYIAESVVNLYENRTKIKGLEMTYEPPALRHFRAKLKPVEG